MSWNNITKKQVKSIFNQLDWNLTPSCKDRFSGEWCPGHCRDCDYYCVSQKDLDKAIEKVLKEYFQKSKKELGVDD